MANINKVIYGGRTLIDLSGDTISPDKLLVGFKAHMPSVPLLQLRFCSVRLPV